MPDSILRIILDFQSGTAPAQLGTLAADLQGVGAAATEADAGLTALAEGSTATTGAVAGTTAGLGAYNVETGMALQGTEGLAAAMAAFDAEAAATVAAEAEVAAAEAAAAEAAVTAAGATDIMATANTVATGAMMGLAGAGIAAGLAVGGAKAVFDNTVGSAAALGLEVRKLSLETGASAEQSSKLIYAADVSGVSFDTLSRGINIATRALATHKSLGIEPTIAGLGQLSDMYLALEPGVDRDAFLLHEFGRSGADLAPLLLLGSAGIKALGDQAQLTGNVLSDSAANDLHKYSVAMNQLTVDAKGLGVALGVDLAPGVTQVATGGLNLVHTLDLITAAQKDGIITTFGQDVIYAELATGVRTLKSVYDDLAPKVQQYNDKASAAYGATESWMLGLQDFNVAAVANNGTLVDAAGLVAQYTGQLDPLANAEHKAALATQALSDAQQVAYDKQAIAAGLAGTLTKNAEAYDKVLDGNAAKIQKLKDEIAKYNAEQGMSITVVGKGKVSQEDYQVATERAANDLVKYNDALQGTIDKHGVLHHVADTTIEGLRITAEAAANSVDDMSKNLQSSSQTTADFTTAIAKDQTALDLLTGANSDAETAMHKANKEFAVQQASVGLTGKALLDFDLAMGVIDKPTYDATVKLEGLNAQFQKDGDVTKFSSAVGLVVDQINGVPPVVDKIPAVLQPATDAFWKAADAANAAATKIGSIPTEVTSHINIITTYSDVHNSTYAGGGPSGGTSVVIPPHAARGADFVVPPGFANDSFPMFVGSGEHVRVTPAGQKDNHAAGGGITNIYNTTINDTKGAAMWQEKLRQDKLRQMESMMA